MQPTLSRLERTLLLCDAPPFDLIYRGLVGYAITPVYGLLWPGDHTVRGLLAAWLLVLAASRIAPMVSRIVLPFSGALKAAWSERRQLAKHVDSYQWRKLLGVGLGWAIYCLVAGAARGDMSFIGAFACIAAGIAGWIFWSLRHARYRVPSSKPAQVH